MHNTKPYSISKLTPPHTCRYPTLRAQHKDASFGVRLWVPPQGSPREECMEWLDDPIHFNVTVTVVHAWTGASNWTASERWRCAALRCVALTA